MNDTSKSFLTPKEAATYMRCSTVFLNQQRKAGDLPAAKIGRKVLYDRGDIDRFVKSKMQTANGK
jgi:excisionase family DNA binding protein